MWAAAAAAAFSLADGVLYAFFFTREFETPIRALDLGCSVASLLVAALWTVVLVLFLMWVFRTSKNLRFATAQPLQNSPGSAVAWFFVPYANLIMPRRVLKEIWYASHAGRADGHSIVNRLWALWLVAIAYSLSISVFMAGTTTATTRALALIFYTGYYVMEVALGFVILAFVTTCTASYEENVDETLTTPVDRAVTAPEGWHADPTHRHELRFWNGHGWTEWVSDAGIQSQDPL
jgi:hypothetical protein